MLIRYPDGSYAEGTIFGLEGNTMRTSIEGVEDAVEYTLIRNSWTSKAGVVVTFEFTMGRGDDGRGDDCQPRRQFLRQLREMPDPAAHRVH
jgi:hypothetical protein